jgi:hypothetical protein
MGGGRVSESWGLKVDRAEQHLQEFKAAIDGYAQGHSYQAVRVVGGAKCHEHTTCWRYRLYITQPDPVLSVIFGDVLYNLRSALDHLAVAMVPSTRRSSASFPVAAEDIWAKQNGCYIVRNPEQRRSFRTAVRGMPAPAVEAIKSIQPYGMGQHPEGSALYQLNRLNNADKHRQLVTFVSGLMYATVAVTVRGVPLNQYAMGQSVPEETFTQDGAMIAHGGREGLPVTPEAEMDVQIDGAPVVAVKIVEADGDGGTGYMEILSLFDTLFPWLRDQVFPALEPYVRRR